MCGDCKTDEDVWQLEVLVLQMKIAKDTFKEIIGIIKLSYHNASGFFIHYMVKNINNINEHTKKEIYFYPKYASRNTGTVTPEYGPGLSIIVSDLEDLVCFKIRVVFWMMTFKIHLV